MEMIKVYFLIVAYLAAVLFTVPDASAAPNNAPPASEIVKEPGTETETKTIKSMWDLVRVGGAVMWALGALALYGFYMAGAQIYVILFSNDRDKDKKFLEGVVAAGESAGEQVEAEIQRRDKAAFPKICGAALGESHHGKAAMEEALVQEGAMQLGALKRGLRPLQIVIAVAPLLGLLGTVYGMISSFQSVELAGAGGDKVELLSRGIYEALVTTATGLTIAIPFLLLYHWLSRRADEIGVNLNRHSRVFLEAFTSGGRGGSVAATQMPEGLQPTRGPE
jgi:biopolymer transport protein ExbB